MPLPPVVVCVHIACSTHTYSMLLSGTHCLLRCSPFFFLQQNKLFHALGATFYNSHSCVWPREPPFQTPLPPGLGATAATVKSSSAPVQPPSVVSTPPPTHRRFSSNDHQLPFNCRRCPPPKLPTAALVLRDASSAAPSPRHQAIAEGDPPCPPARHGQQPVSGTADPRSNQTGQVIQGLR